MKTHSWPVKISYFFTRAILGPVIRTVWVKSHKNVHHIKKHKHGALIAANHQSFFDFLCLVAVSKRNIHFLSAEKFFRHPLWKTLMKLTGQIKVDRTAEDKSSVHTSVGGHLSKKQLVGIFPEGTRSPSPTEMLKAFTGVARYALEHQVPIIPVGIKGAHEIQSKHEKKPKFKKLVDIEVGEPMYFEMYYGKHKDEQALIEVTEAVMMQIEILSGKTYPHYITRKANVVE